MCRMWTRAEYKIVLHNACENLVTPPHFLFKFSLKKYVTFFIHTKTWGCLNLFMYVYYTSANTGLS